MVKKGEPSKEDIALLIPWSHRHRKGKLRDTSMLPRIKDARWEHGVRCQNGERFILALESINSDLVQGISLTTDSAIVTDGKSYPRNITIFNRLEYPHEYVVKSQSPKSYILMFPSTREITFDCYTQEGMLWIWNVWAYFSQNSMIIQSHDLYAGMLVEELPNGYRYRCNEGRDDDDYDDLIFRIERTEEITPPLRGRGKRVDEQKKGTKTKS